MAEDRHPADPNLSVPASEYQSVFAGYQSFLDAERKSWRDANNEVGSAGGHAGHSMPGAPPADRPEPQDEKTPAPINPQSGHGGH